MPRAGACEQTQNCTEISWLPQAEEIGLYLPEPLLLSTQCFYGYTFPSFLTHAFSYTPALPRAVCLSVCTPCTCARARPRHLHPKHRPRSSSRSQPKNPIPSRRGAHQNSFHSSGTPQAASRASNPIYYLGGLGGLQVFRVIYGCM